MIVSVLDNLVDRVLKVVNVGLIVPNDVSVRLDGLLDHTLSQPEVLDHIAQTCVDIIIFPKSLVH